MRTEDLEIVRILPLFRTMERPAFDALCAAGYLQRFPAGVVLVHEGERPDFLHVLVAGTIEFFSRRGERETTLAVLSPPAAFILAAVIVDDVYLKSARTLSPATVVLIPTEAVRDVFDKDTAFARATVHELACRYRALVKTLKSHRLRTGLQRLACWIITEDEQTGRTGSFRIRIEKRALANQLGLRPENLSRAFVDLQKSGVDVDGTSVRIRDRRVLMALAEPDPSIDGT